MYSCNVTLVLISMIVTGAGRSVAVKLFYQMGFENPLFVTLLYLTGQAISLFVHLIFRYTNNYLNEYSLVSLDNEIEQDPALKNQVQGKELDSTSTRKVTEDQPETLVSRADFNAGDEAGIENPNEEKKESGDGGISLSPFQIKRASDEKHLIFRYTNNRLNEYSLVFVDNEIEQDPAVKNQVQGKELDSASTSRKVTEDQPEALVSRGDFSAGDEADVENPNEEKKEAGDGGISLSPFQIERASDEKFIENEHQEAERFEPSRSVAARGLTRQGSDTGLTSESKKAVWWVHSIPWYLKPAIPGFFNMCNSAMRWGSLIYVSASIAEMLISGLELVLSVLAARLIRKRIISRTRWMGVIVVSLGLVFVRLADVVGNEEDQQVLDESRKERYLSALLIVGQCIMSVFQDMAEELFMQEADFHPILLLGMEGLFGLFWGIPLYFLLASYFGEAPSETWSSLASSSFKSEYIIGLICVFTATGIFNIKATCVTSSMTRNIWKNFRTILVWTLGLLIFYITGNQDLGEEWVTPQSFFILIGFVIMLSGTFFYYAHQ